MVEAQSVWHNETAQSSLEQNILQMCRVTFIPRQRWWDAADACRNSAGSRDSFQSGDPQFSCSFCQGVRSEGGGFFELVRLPFLKLLWKWFPRPLPVWNDSPLCVRCFRPFREAFILDHCWERWISGYQWLSGWIITWNNHLPPVQYGSLELAFLHDSAEESLRFCWVLNVT